MAPTKHLRCRVGAERKQPIIIVSKKVAHLAVERNKVKRRIREILRLSPYRHFKGYIYTQKGITTLLFSELRDEIYELLGSCK